MKKLIDFFKEDDGATMPEYAMMVALIAAVAIATVTALGTAVSGSFSTTQAAIAGS